MNAQKVAHKAHPETLKHTLKQGKKGFAEAQKHPENPATPYRVAGFQGRAGRFR
jgi:hypothetical protein